MKRPSHRPERVGELIRQTVGAFLTGDVREGFECGIGVENFNDVKVGDLIEAYRIEEVARSLSA